MKPRHTAEQSTVKVNKGKKLGKAGFGSTGSATKAEAVVNVPVESIAKSSVGEVPIDGVEEKPAAKSNSAKRGFGFAAGVDSK